MSRGRRPPDPEPARDAGDPEQGGETAGDLRASEARFRALVTNSTDVLEIIDDEGVVRYVSPAVETMLGRTPDSLVGTSSLDLIAPEDRHGVRRRFAALLRAGQEEPLRFEARALHSDGSVRWIDCIMTNRLDDPDVDGVVANVRDVTDQRRALDALLNSEALFRTLATASPIGIFRFDADLNPTYINERFREITGIHEVRHSRPQILEAMHPDDAEALMQAWRDTGARGLPMTLQTRFSHEGGSQRWVSIRTSPVVGPDGTVSGHVGTLEDITERVEAARDAARLTSVLSATSDLVAITGRTGELLYVNDAFCEFFDVDRSDLGTLHFPAVTPLWAQQRYADEAIPALRNDGIWSGEFAYYRRGVEVPMSALFIAHRDDDGRLEFVSSITRDISERKALEERLAHQATHDPLTGLPNRALLLDRLQVALARAERTNAITGLLFLDLDHFKVINDSLGHGAGDQLLVAIAGRLRSVVRPADTVARFGGDEFVVLCEGLDDESDGFAIAERVGAMLRSSVDIEGNELFVSGSLGIAFSKGGATDPEALIRDADAAMYSAKARGRARFEVFDDEMRRSALDRLDTEHALRRAIERRELRILYHPQIDLATGRVRGAEAQLRWEHPERGMLNPADFLPIAEESGLIAPIGRWAAEQACRVLARAQASGAEQFVMAVNITARQLAHPTLRDDLAAAVARAGVEPSSLELEIAENVAIETSNTSARVFEDLRALGVRIALDDFGTGYSALAYLRRSPVDSLKIDRVFIRGIEDEPRDDAIVAAIIAMARGLGVHTVALGVENEAQLARLRELGCDVAQGSVVATPLTSADLIDWLGARL